MDKWQKQFARELIYYAMVMLLLAGGSLFDLWFWRDKEVALLHKNLFRGAFAIGGNIFAVLACACAAVMCLQARRHLLNRHQRREQTTAQFYHWRV